MAPREGENNPAYAKFRGDKQRALWYVMVFSGLVNFVWIYQIKNCQLLLKGGQKGPNCMSVTVDRHLW